VRKRPAASPGLSHSGMVAFGIDAIAAIPMRCARASPFETTTFGRSASKESETWMAGTSPAMTCA